MVEGVWDKEFASYDLEAIVQLAKGIEIDICTVRSESLSDSSLGNLFWILLANRFASSGSRVNIYDFPNNSISPEVLPAQRMADILGLKDASVHRAESQDTTHALELLKIFSADYAANPDNFPGIHPKIKESLKASGAQGKLDASLDRMVEELAVFLNGSEDKNRIQLMGHERETVQLVRYLGTPPKQYWRVDLGGIVSEFRAERIPTLAEFPDRLIMGTAQGAVYYNFFVFVLDELTRALVGLAGKKCPTDIKHWGTKEIRCMESDRVYLVLDKVGEINPRLKSYAASVLLDMGKPAYHRINGDFVMEEVQRGWKYISETKNPDYNWALRLLSITDSNTPEEKKLARNIIHASLPKLTGEELFYHGRRVWESDNRGRGLLFLKAYIDRGFTDKTGEIVKLYERSKFGYAKREMGIFLLGRGMVTNL